MSDDFRILENETDIKRAEYLLKRDEFELRKEELRQKSKNDAKAWQRVIAAPLIIAIIAAVLSGLAALYTENTKIAASGENGKFAREHALLLEADKLEAEERLERLCQYAFSRSFQHDDAIFILNQFKADHPNCTEAGFAEPINPVEVADLELQQCIEQASIQTASCRAYDKSGFHSSPSDSCTIDLTAPDGQFFAKNQVSVVDEFYRRLSGPPAQEAVQPAQDSTPVRRFSGRISCSNSAGTGRTCEARATVQLPSYDDRCLPFLEELANL